MGGFRQPHPNPKPIAEALLRQSRYQTHQLKEAVAALRKSEQKLRAYAEMSADWFWEQGPDLRYVLQSIIPLTSLPTDVGKTRWEFADPAMDPIDGMSIKPISPPGDPSAISVGRIQTDGKRRYMSTSGNPVFDAAGTFLGYYGTGRDLLHGVEAAEALRRAIEQAEIANHATYTWRTMMPSPASQSYAAE